MPAQKNNPSSRRALLVRNAAAYDFGGAERFVVYLADELVKNGWEPTIATAHTKIIQLATDHQVPAIKSWWWKRQDWSGSRLLLFPIYLLWEAALTVQYLRLMATVRPDVVHVQSRDDFIAGTLAARILRKRVVWTDHADLKYIYQNVGIWYKNPVGKLVRWCSKKADHITLVSKSEHQLISAALQTDGLPDNYQIIYNGLLDYTPKPFARPAADKDAIVFCCTSRLVNAKGIGELISAFQASNQKGGLRLWILGEGPDAKRFKEQAKDDPAITFWGFPENSLDILKAADIFVHPSYHEGFSISIVEAAMLHMPIIACDIGGNPEIIINDQTGLLIPVKDSEALATAMQRLAVSPGLREQLARNARTIYEQRFQFDTIVKEQFIPAYED